MNAKVKKDSSLAFMIGTVGSLFVIFILIQAYYSELWPFTKGIFEQGKDGVIEYIRQEKSIVYIKLSIDSNLIYFIPVPNNASDNQNFTDVVKVGDHFWKPVFSDTVYAKLKLSGETYAWPFIRKDVFNIGGKIKSYLSFSSYNVWGVIILKLKIKLNYTQHSSLNTCMIPQQFGIFHLRIFRQNRLRIF